MPARLMNAVAELERFQGPVKVSRLEHSLQSATRAHRAGKDKEYVAAALIHDIGDALAPHSHGEMVAGVLRPFVSERICWIVQKHALFQAYYYAHLEGGDRNAPRQVRRPSLLRRLRRVLRALRPELLRPRLRLAAARVLPADRRRGLPAAAARRGRPAGRVSQLDFNEQLAAEMEVIYRGRDILRRRALVHEALGASRGDRVLDAGCGPGFYFSELLERVGREGSVVGVDAERADARPGGQALRGARQRRASTTATSRPCRSRTPTSTARSRSRCSSTSPTSPPPWPSSSACCGPAGACCSGTSTGPPCPGTPTNPRAWSASCAAWDEHLSDPALPRTLAARLRAAGFEDVELTGHAFATDDVSEQSYAGALLQLMADYVGGDEARAWADEQRELQARGESYFACIQFCFTGDAAAARAGSGAGRRTRGAGSPAAARPRYERSSSAAPAIASSIARCEESRSWNPDSSPSTARIGVLGPITRSVQPSRGRASVLARRRLERPHHGRADRDHPAAQLARQVGALGREARHAEPLGVRALARLERRHAGVQHQRRHVDPGGHQLCHQLGRERPARARHLGAAGLVRVDRLVAIQRPRAARVPVADRLPVARQVVRARSPAGAAPPATACLRRGAAAAPPWRRPEQQHVALGSALEALVGSAQLDQPGRAIRQRAPTGACAGRRRARARAARPASSRRC